VLSPDEKPNKKKRNMIAIGSGVLALTVCCIAGAIYTQSTDATPTPTAPVRAATIEIPTDAPTQIPTDIPTNTPAPTETPIPTNTLQAATNTPITGIQLVQFSEIVYAGEEASLSILTAPGSVCSIIYLTPGGNISEAEGLGDKIANDAGTCLWVWLIGINTDPGVGSVTVTAGEYSQSWEITIK